MEVSARDALLHLLTTNMPEAWYVYWRRIVDEKFPMRQLPTPRV